MKIKSLVAAIILALVCVAVVTGQKRRQMPPAKPSATPSPSPTPTPLSTLSIEVGLIYNNGDVKPVARTTFYLLDEDLAVILKPFDVSPGSLSIELDSLDGISYMTTVAPEYREKAKKKYDQIKAAIPPHIIATTTTDFSGKAKFESLTPGTRFVYGEFHVGRERVAWNVKVELTAGKDAALILDNSNRSP